MAEHRKRLMENFVSLSVVQGLTIVFPIITFPYLLRVLGIEGFGVFTMIQAFIMYLDLVVSFGFGLTATQRISRSAQDEGGIKKIIVAVYFIKLLLFSGSFIVLLSCSLFIPYIKQHILLLLISSLYLLGNLLFPDWYFQGIQKMRNITLVTFTSKAISLLLIILLVKEKTDIEYALLSMSAGNLVAGIIAALLLFKNVSKGFSMPNMNFVKELFKESSYVFVSIMLVPLYGSINIFILRAFTNPLMVGYYSIADKILQSTGMLASIVNRTFHPHLAHLYITSLSAYKKNITKVLTIIAAFFLAFSLFQFFGASFIIKILLGTNHSEDISYAVMILRIMSVALFFSPFVSFFFQVMIIQGQKKEAIINIAIAASVNLVSACIFTWFWSGIGLAINLSLVVMLICYLNRRSFVKKIQALNT